MNASTNRRGAAMQEAVALYDLQGFAGVHGNEVSGAVPQVCCAMLRGRVARCPSTRGLVPFLSLRTGGVSQKHMAAEELSCSVMRKCAPGLNALERRCNDLGSQIIYRMGLSMPTRVAQGTHWCRYGASSLHQARNTHRQHNG